VPRSASSPRATRTIRLRRPLDLALTLGPLRRGRTDPCTRIDGRHVWRASWTPDGPVSLHLHHADPDRLEVEAWGAGADWAVAHAPTLVGEDDDVDAFVELLDRTDSRAAPLIRRLHRERPGLRMPRSGALVEAMVPVVLEQKVTGQSARRSYRGIVWGFGEPAPAAPGSGRPLRLPPHPSVLAELPEWAWHRHNVEARRAGTIRRVASRAGRLDEAVDLAPGVAQSRLRTIAGVGEWSIAEASLVALGDPDAVSVGDFHLKNHVAFALRGVPRGDDAEMLEVLEPFRGQRGRVCRLIVLGAAGAPRYGPRLSNHDIRRL
jgi:3-methyladenine DNA glycosylase/8-oxoguanine DNA glycosylase